MLRPIEHWLKIHLKLDEFDIEEGITPIFKHKPKILGDRGKPIVYYVNAKLENGENLIKWMTKHDMRIAKSPTIK